MSVCLLAHGRCCTNISELPWAGLWEAFYSSRKEGSNTAFCADSVFPVPFRPPGTNNDRILTVCLILEPHTCLVKIQGAPLLILLLPKSRFCLKSHREMFAGFWSGILVGGEMEWGVMICAWMLPWYQAGLHWIPSDQGTRETKLVSRKSSAGKGFSHLSLSFLISHFLFFWLVSLSCISHHTMTWTTEWLMSFTLSSSVWQPV